jgi:hypothetical protein
LKGKQVKTAITIILFLISNFVNAESWNCSYKNSSGLAEEMSIFKKSGNSYEWITEFSHLSKEPDKFDIIKKSKDQLTLLYEDYLVTLKKIDNSSGTIRFIELKGGPEQIFNGNCLITK